MVYGSSEPTPYEHDHEPHFDGCDCIECNPECSDCDTRVGRHEVTCTGCLTDRRYEAASKASKALVEDFVTMARRVAAMERGK